MTQAEEAFAKVYGPGAPFELVDEEVLGERLPVFKNRPRSLREMLARSAAHGDKEYVVHGERRIRYAEHVQLVARLAARLRDDYGVGPGSRVAILAENRPEWILTFWATVSLGGIVVALNGWWTRDEIEYGLELAEPTLFVADAKRRARLDGDPSMTVVDMDRDFPPLIEGPDCELPAQPLAEDDAALLLFTSGTTGRPKGALISHRGLIGFVQCAQSGGFLGMLMNPKPPDPNALPLASLMTSPLFHVSGLFAGAIMMLANGAKTVWRSGRFDPLEVLRLIQEERITNWTGLGSMAPQVLNHPDLENYDLSSIRNLGSGGAPLSPAVIERIQQVAPNGSAALAIGYGSSESVSVIASVGGAELAAHPASTGRPSIGHEVEIRGPDGRVLPDGEQGEIHVRSAYIMLEYWRNPAATAKTILPGRWLATGDVGHLEDGRLYINSRARDMILRAAENIYPVEIEHRIDLHPAVRETAVVGVDHPELGQEVKAIVVPVAGESPDPDDLAKWCGEKLAKFKVPSVWEIRSEPLPRNAAGKVMKNVLTGEAENNLLEE